MKRKIITLQIFILCGILTSCLGVFYIDLGNRYAWLESRTIMRIKEKTENGLYGDWIIYPQVLNYDYDDRYIIAYQVYDGGGWYSACLEEEIKDSLFLLYAKLREIKHCYWIIDKETENVMGPMRKNEFDKKCVELDVKAKMSKFHEKKFWVSKVLNHDDSLEIKTRDSVIDATVRKYKKRHAEK